MEEINFRLAGDTDIDKINLFYNSVYKKNRDKLEFTWEFNTAPAGKAIYVVAEHNGFIIGTQCVIPYYVITYGNTVILTGKSEDTLVSSDFRGRHIFEKMYALLIEACRKNNITVIWGFTYAVKPFLKLGFQVPFRSKMGLLVLKPRKAARYFASLSAKNTGLDKLKITGLSFASYIKALLLKAKAEETRNLSFEQVSLNRPDFNYLKNEGSFGLKLDTDFMDYRINKNPFSKRYTTCNYMKNGNVSITLTFNITEENVGYIIQLYVQPSVTKRELKGFTTSMIQATDLKDCSALRYWGFSHNQQNREEIDWLRSCGFTFIDRGIAFVWLPLTSDPVLDPRQFVLSRMASQGTD